MKKRIFIFGWFNFPRGSASANYIEYFAKALKLAGYQVILISNLSKDYRENIEFEYCGFKVHPIELSDFKLFHYVQYKYLMTNIVKSIVKKYNPCEDDIFITYGEARKQFHEVAFSIKKSFNMKIACCVAEWLGKENFQSDVRARKYQKIFDTLLIKYDLIIPISHKIEDFFIEKKVKTLYLPIMADTQEFPYEYNKSGKIKFIFSANGKMKDSLESMLRGISSLSKEKVKQIEFHLTGVKESTVREILGDNFDSMQDVIILHSWMEYKDLVELYNQAHFLFLAREKNHMTESNFPSKVPEAMTYGVIPIVSDVGDYTKYYLEDGKNALIMNGYDVEVCMKSLNRAIVLPKEEIKSLSNRCREFAEDVFDYRNWTDIINFGLEVLSED